jgi:hypothetical protein
MTLDPRSPPLDANSPVDPHRTRPRVLRAPYSAGRQVQATTSGVLGNAAKKDRPAIDSTPPQRSVPTGRSPSVHPHRRVAVAETPEPDRAFDIGEQEGHGPARRPAAVVPVREFRSVGICLPRRSPTGVAGSWCAGRGPSSRRAARHAGLRGQIGWMTEPRLLAVARSLHVGSSGLPCDHVGPIRRSGAGRVGGSRSPVLCVTS